MPFDKDSETETQPGLDIDAAAAEISSDLFGQDGEEEVGDPDLAEGEQEGEPSPPGADEPPSAPQPGEADAPQEPKEGEEPTVENAEAVQAVGAPKTWSKEALETWTTIPPRAQQEILKREEDFFRGIGQYKAGAELGQRYNAVVEPYAPLLAAEQIDPVQLFQSFSANHYLLSRGTPTQKLEIAANLVKHYGIPVQGLVEYIGEQAVAEPLDPTIVAMQKELAELRGALQQDNTIRREAAQAQIATSVDEFAKDGNHPYFDEVAEDMAKLVETGLATSLQDAYDRAVFANPVTRQKEIDRLTAEKLSSAETVEKTRQDKISRLTAADVKTQPHNRSGTTPVGTMDDTLEKTMGEIKARA